MPRMIYEVANDIRGEFNDMRKPVYFAAVPYLQAAQCLQTFDQAYGQDDAESVVIYLLSNLQYSRGGNLAALKRELKVMLHEHNPRRYKMPK